LALGVRLQAEFAYVLTDDSSILGYRINPNTGALTAIAGSPFAGGKGASSVTVDPRGKFVYVANLGNSVSAYAINPTTGILTLVVDSPFTEVGNPVFVPVHPSGKFRIRDQPGHRGAHRNRRFDHHSGIRDSIRRGGLNRQVCLCAEDEIYSGR
jgi:DNA-binding beta-propeller fold protein YncE